MNIIIKTINYMKEISLGYKSRYIIFTGFGIAAIGFTIWYKQLNYLPKKWKKVGEISDLMCFPVKSCGAIRENEFECTHLGIQNGPIRDRRFMLIDLNGQSITGRQEPKLVKVTPIVSESTLILIAPGMMDHSLDINYLQNKSTINATIWGEKVPTVDCGEEVAKWFSRFLLSEDVGFRLVYFPFDTTTRDIRKKNNIFQRLSKSDSGALHETTHFNLVAESSIAELNTRLTEPVTPQHFRPNFVVKGSPPYAEDTWNYIKIGKTAVFQNVKPSIRCSSITVNPETGLRHTKLEPLITLKQYRQIYDPLLRSNLGDCPVMGLNLGMRVSGTVKLGDPVYIGLE